MGQRYYAHSLENEPEEKWQTVEAHLQQVAQLAKNFGADFEAGKWAEMAGRWHDVGKYSLEFQKRIGADIDANIELMRGRPDHSTAGAQHADAMSKQLGKFLAYPIAGHHAGLPNGQETSESCLFKRLKKVVPDWSACPEKILEPAALGMPPFAKGMAGKKAGKRIGFQASFFIRMLYSCLVDADFLDTEQFVNPEKADWRKGYPGLESLNEKLILYLNDLVKSAEPTHINKDRDKILRHCLDAAEKEPGLFSLTVPTGGGKTLSSLAFALKHALKYGLKRVIYVIPYTSIIEQNAAVFREILGDSAVLEHHSNFELKDEKDEDRRSRSAAENWDAPLVVTTNVQFFESLFHSRSSKCRKLHNIAKSVVILDEAQMLPVPFLRPCVETLRELSEFYSTSIVLCTATQPALSEEDLSWRLENVREIMPEPATLYEAFRRVNAEYVSKLSDEELAERLARHEQVLCVVNTRKHARLIYEKIKGDGCYHLSALMCPAHRSEKLAEIRQALDAGRPCRVISTQLIEAGVDIDFPVVYRSAAGIDSVAQAAGRCNREGRIREGGQVCVFMPEDGLPPGYFRQNAETAEIVMRHHDDMLSPDAVREYFETLYWRKGDDELDREEILKDLWEGAQRADFPFRTVAGKFNIIDKNGMDSVIVPFKTEPSGLIDEIEGTDKLGQMARKLQRYTVQIPKRVFYALEAASVIERVRNQFCVLINKDIYKDELGLCPEDPTFHESESLMT